MTKNEHVKIETQPDGSHVLTCERCQAELAPTLPVPLARFLKICRKFETAHANCRTTEKLDRTRRWEL